MRKTIGILAGGLLLCGVPAFAQGSLFGQTPRAKHYANSLAPYVVSPQQIVDRMLELADLKPGETLYDLGSGDGRILITAVQHFRARAVGIEIGDALGKSPEQRLAGMGVQNQIRVIHADCRTVDLAPADVVTMYLMTESNASLRPQL